VLIAPTEGGCLASGRGDELGEGRRKSPGTLPLGVEGDDMPREHL
jgi:hypothetical protein